MTCVELSFKQSRITTARGLKQARKSFNISATEDMVNMLNHWIITSGMYSAKISMPLSTGIKVHSPSVN
jgi:hypothetical protein